MFAPHLMHPTEELKYEDVKNKQHRVAEAKREGSKDSAIEVTKFENIILEALFQQARMNSCNAPSVGPLFQHFRRVSTILI